MKLLFAIKNLNLEGGGAERVLVEVANGLAARGHALTVLTFDPPGGTSFYPLDPGVARIETGLLPREGRVGLLPLLRGAPEIRRSVRRLAPDAIIVFMHSMLVPLVGVLAGIGAPLVFSEHIDLAHYRTRPAQRALRVLAERFVAAKTVPSRSVRDEFPARRHGWIHVLPNPVGASAFAAAAQRAPASPPVLLGVGRFREQKNHVELVRAFAALAPRFPCWTLRLVGDGPLRGAIEAEVRRLGLGDRVVLPGTSRDIAAEYAAASIVAIPSHYESFGLVAAEALASARPVVSFDRCLGVAEMVEDGRTGLLVGGADSAGRRVGNLAAGLARLMADPELRCRLGRAGPPSVERFRPERVIERWEALLRCVAASPGAAPRR